MYKTIRATCISGIPAVVRYIMPKAKLLGLGNLGLLKSSSCHWKRVEQRLSGSKMNVKGS